jgi:hypothetical protein
MYAILLCCNKYHTHTHTHTHTLLYFPCFFATLKTLHFTCFYTEPAIWDSTLAGYLTLSQRHFHVLISRLTLHRPATCLKSQTLATCASFMTHFLFLPSRPIAPPPLMTDRRRRPLWRTSIPRYQTPHLHRSRRGGTTRYSLQLNYQFARCHAPKHYFFMPSSGFVQIASP